MTLAHQTTKMRRRDALRRAAKVRRKVDRLARDDAEYERASRLISYFMDAKHESAVAKPDAQNTSEPHHD